MTAKGHSAITCSCDNLKQKLSIYQSSTNALFDDQSLPTSSLTRVNHCPNMTVTQDFHVLHRTDRASPISSLAMLVINQENQNPLLIITSRKRRQGPAK